MISSRLLIRRNRQTGYSLFELIISISIITIVFGLAVAAYNTFNKRERLRQSGLTLKANLRFAQTKSFSAEKPSSGCTTYAGMRVTFTANSYSIVHMCTEGAVGTPIDVTLPTDITFSPTPSTFTFLPLSRSTSLSADQSLILTKSVATYTVVVSAVGTISNPEQ